MSVRNKFFRKNFKSSISNKLFEVEPLDVHRGVDREFRIGHEGVINFKSKLFPMIDGYRMIQDYSSGFSFLFETGFR